MIRTKLIAQMAVAACTVCAVWFAAGAGSARAEQPQITTGPVGPGRPMPPMMSAGGGGFFPGGASVAVDDGFLYIVRGSEVLKLHKSDLAMVGSAELPPPRFSNGVRSVPGAGGFSGGGFGVRGGGTPPPKPNL